jgi:hypothetical protein
MDEPSGETDRIRWSQDKRGVVLVGIPIAGGLLNAFSFQVGLAVDAPRLLLNGVILALVVLGTLAVASRDARELGFEASILVLFLWIAGYPAHMAQRRRRGMHFGVSWAVLAIAAVLAMPIVVPRGPVPVRSVAPALRRPSRRRTTPRRSSVRITSAPSFPSRQR